MIAGQGLLFRACSLLLLYLGWQAYGAPSYAGHLANLGVTVTQHPSKPFNPVRVSKLVIDGWPDTTTPRERLSYLKCGQTGRGDNPWVQLDLKKVYLVSVVRVIIFSRTGQNVVVRVGNSLTNDGNDNHECGRFPYLYSDSGYTIWRDIRCSPSVWGRYINFQRTVTNGILEICEATFNYDAIVDTKIVINGNDIDGHGLSVATGRRLSKRIDCIVNATNSVSLTWKFGNTVVQTSSSGQQQPDIYQVKQNSMQQLHITEISASDEGVYTCDASVGRATVLSRSFGLNSKVECVWGTWSACSSSCGLGNQNRTLSRYGGKDCRGPSIQDCLLRPCTPTVIDTRVSVDEGTTAELSCEATQVNGSDSITFGWFKVQEESLVNARTARVKNMTTDVGVGKFRSRLIFTNANRMDRGDYKCQAYHKYGTSLLSAVTSLDVKYGPESISIHPDKPVGIEGQAFTLSCSALGNPSPSYHWKLPDNTQRPKKTLSWQNVQFTDKGTYTCYATVQLATKRTVSTTAKLRVEGRPRKCSKPSARSDEASSIVIAVKCPDNGNSKITEYEIFYRTRNQRGMYMRFTAQPFIVQNLSTFTSYEVAVQAANKYGYGRSWSKFVKVKTAEGEPGPPGLPQVEANGSRWASISWSPPQKPNGDIHYYLLYVQLHSVVHRSVGFDRTMNVTGTTTNVTMMNPFSNYSIRVAAVTIRTHDNKTLIGENSTVFNFTTLEDVPSEPRNLSYVPQPPSHVDLSWTEPSTPNGIVRHYIVHYWRQDGTGNVTTVGPVRGLNVSLHNLTSSAFYNVSVQAYTVGYGVVASINVVSHAIRPSSPQSVTVSALTSSSLQVTWKPPLHRNGNLKMYKIYYRISSLEEKFAAVVVNITVDQDSYTITNLKPYTNYTVHVTVINNAKHNSESERSNSAEMRTLAAPPDEPLSPKLPYKTKLKHMCFN